MHPKVEKKSPSYYLLEKHLIGSNIHWFYLYTLTYNTSTGTLLIEIGPNNDEKDRRRWLFRNVRAFQKVVDPEDGHRMSFPQMILGIDSYKDSIQVIACCDVEFCFTILDLPIELAVK